VRYEEFLRKYFLKATALLLLIFFADIFILSFGVMKLEKKADNLVKKADSGKKDIQNLTAKVDEKEAEVKKLSEGRLVIETLTKQIFQKRSERFIAFQKEIQRLVESAGMPIDKYDYKYDVVPKDLEKDNWKNGYVEVSMNFSLQGSYPQVKKLLSLIEDSGHFITINGLAISQTNQGGALLDLKIAITTFFVFDPEEDMIEGGK
jgi:Tfp pilus assembly protein PilO